MKSIHRKFASLKYSKASTTYNHAFTYLKAIIPIIALAIFSMACNSPERPAQDHDTSFTEASNSDSPQPTNTSANEKGQHLHIMSYNVLRYGCGCQADNGTLHSYLRSIVRFANPDVAGLLKVDAINQSTTEKDHYAPKGFADSILRKAMNAAYPGRYAVCPFTNKADANNINLLFYDQHKLGYSGMETLVTDETDFNLFKLYLQSSITGNGHDTLFLYFILNHTESGDNPDNRDRQMAAVMTALHHRFTILPNIINMGDFNLRNTSESGYQTLTAGKDEAFRFADPPFALDHSLKYPADWENSPDSYARYLTTSTRKKKDEPNDCGTGGGAKFWYDHILLSPAIARGSNGVQYAPKSFHVLGNDGNRSGRSVNADKHPNTAVPASIAEALFQLSNKYPVLLDLQIVGKK